MADDAGFDEEGELEIKKKSIGTKTWKKHYFILVGGSLYYYKTSENKHSGEFHLKGCKVDDKPDGSKTHSFSLKGDKDMLILAADSQEEKDAWLKAIKANLDKDKVPGPERKQTKKSLAYRAKNAVSSKVATSGAGRAVIREIVPEAALTVLDCIKRFIEKIENAEKATQLEKDVIRIGTKVVLLFKEKKIAAKEFLALEKPLREACSMVIDGHEIPFAFDENKLADAFANLRTLIEKLLKPHLTPKNLDKIRAIFDYTKPDMLLKFFNEENKELPVVAALLRKAWDKKKI
eukprot:TRINITY_DN5503_c0_g1_i1.p1 TRINITY_DN5503_c0_g1~~TRINITY_DN5503_c0_g1_i1.p1  ORF type:complete len:310 (+),score=106.77 TRINITY_DN5503_c0_g1_i1:59-931(+)